MRCHTLASMINLDELLVTARQRRELPDPPLRRFIRERALLTQAEVAETLGVTDSAVCRWEAGRRTPRGVMKARYAELLGRLSSEVLQ
jgi:DNA-binding transcriptional regulator YiaG